MEPGDYRATTTTVASVVGASTQAYSRDNDLHAKLMDEIHLPHPLKDVSGVWPERQCRPSRQSPCIAAWLNLSSIFFFPPFFFCTLVLTVTE